MQIYISEEAMVGDIQDKFQAMYPYLKLAFFRKPPIKGEHVPDRDRISADIPIEKVRMKNGFGWLDISYYRTAAAVEHDFSHIFGLHVQIDPKTGTLLLERSGTDDWTLEALNNASRPAKLPKLNFPQDAEDD